MILYQNGKKFTEYKYKLENDLEKDIISSYQTLFGPDTIYIEAKKKISSESLGNTIPDGFLFDLSDPDNPEFYLVEIELGSHDFYRHIFPQITKFFAFFRNSNKQKELVQKLFSVIDKDSELKKQFKKYLGAIEIFKFLSDVVDSSQNILIVLDVEKPEMPEIMNTYADTWGKMVKVLTAKKYVCDGESIFAVHPEFETIEYSCPDTSDEDQTEVPNFSEEYHLEYAKDNVKQMYNAIKNKLLAIDSSLIFNPAKNYISIKKRKNVAFLYLRKRIIRLVIMLSENDIRTMAGSLNVKPLSQSVQSYYNGPCASLIIANPTEVDVIVNIICRAVSQSN